jgi:hypothetical protein
MDMFIQQIAEWHTYFETVAVCSATLMGLIFLAISLKLEAFKLKQNANIRQIAWQTFANFFFLLMFSLVFLVPRLSPLTITIPIIIIGVTAIAITISQAVRARKAGYRLINVCIESVPSLVAYIGIIVISILMAYSVMESMVWLLPIVIILLAVAVRNAWSLLVGAREN